MTSDSENWPLVAVGDCADFQEGYVNPSQRVPEYFDGEIKWLRAVDLNDSYVNATSRRLTLQGFQSAGKAAKLFRPGSLAISKSGTIGRLGILQDEMCGNRAVINIESRNDVCEPRFLFYSLLINRARIVQLADGSVQKNLYVSQLSKMEIRLPPLSEQRAIAGVLGALDDKIEQNWRTSAALERLARAIFRAWFVDFEPVKAKAAGAGAFPSMPQFVFDALPIRLVDSELGPVPDGWGVKTLRDVATFVTGGTPSKKEPSYWGGDFPWVSAKDMHERMILDSELRLTVAGRASVRRTAPRHATLMVVRGMSLMTEVRIGWCTREVAFNQDLRAFVPSDGVSPEFLFLWLSSSEDSLIRMVDTASHGTGRISTNRLDAMTIPLSTNAVEAFTEFVQPMIALREAQAHESRHLASLRDYLLPKLLSGAVRVREAERAVRR